MASRLSNTTEPVVSSLLIQHWDFTHIIAFNIEGDENRVVRLKVKEGKLINHPISGPTLQVKYMDLRVKASPTNVPLWQVYFCSWKLLSSCIIFVIFNKKLLYLMGFPCLRTLAMVGHFSEVLFLWRICLKSISKSNDYYW